MSKAKSGKKSATKNIDSITHSTVSDPLVLIPVYNLEDSIEQMIAQTSRFIPKDRILIVDDGSKDATAEIADKLGVIVIRHEVNRGKSGAIKTGFAYFLEHEHLDAVITIDGDLQHPPEFIPAIVDELNKGYDIVMGNRMEDLDHMPYHRRLSNRLSSWGISVVLGDRIPDSQCGFRIHRRWVIERLDLKSKFYAIESEVALQAGFFGARIGHVPIPTIYNGSQSYIHPIKATLRITGLIISYLFKSKKGN